MMHLPALLLVDGDTEPAARIASSLEQFGLATRTAATGREAFALLEAEPFDLVLVELVLPDMSALALLRALQRGSIDVPFVGVGGDPDLDTIVQLMRHGACDYLPKPLTVEAVEAVVDRAARRMARFERLHAGGGLGAVLSAASGGPAAPPDGPTTTASLSPPSVGSRGPTPTGPGGARSQGSTPSPSRSMAASGAPRPAPRPPSARDGAPPRATDLQTIARRLRDGDIELPAIAPIAGQLQQMMVRSDVEVHDIVTVLGSDPSVTAGVLRLANSGRFGTSRPVTDLHDAVVRVGSKRALALAQQAVLASLYSIDVPPIAGMVPALWRNTVVTANGCRELALLLGDDDAEAAFVGGMLHNVGELALLRILAEMPERLDPSGEGLGAVAALLHGAHEDFGRAVLKRWGMPARFVRVAGAHHRPPPGPEDRVSRHRRELTLLGWGMAIERGFRYLPDHEEVDIPHLCTSLGLAVEDVEEVYSKASTW